MKTPDPTKAESSAPVSGKFNGTASLSGSFPARRNTVISEVLARLLHGEQLTGMDAVFCASTTRLAAHIMQLEKAWAWKIDRVDVDVGTKDGRLATIRIYFLARATIRNAFDRGAREYCRSVDVARAARRTKAGKARVEAMRRNAVRLALRVDARQLDMFGGVHG